ncbi:hypothetical protein ACHAW6_010410 [Cyclotella cf. meneghiniana]
MIHMAISKGMYGLPQSGLLANELLEKWLNKHGYVQSKFVLGLWKHRSRPITFCLTVDDFGEKYIGQEHAERLHQVLSADYKVACEWSGTRYISIHLCWDYTNHRVHLFMPRYITKALTIFNHTPSKTENQPFPHMPIKYGRKKQHAKSPSSAPTLNKKGKKFIQQVCGKFLNLGHAVDSTLLVPISAIVAQSSKPTGDTLAQTCQLLDYLATQEDAVLIYTQSDMKLAIHRNASYLCEPGVCSPAGGHVFLSFDETVPCKNGAILNIAHIIKHIMSSASEAELAALYIMACEAVDI